MFNSKKQRRDWQNIVQCRATIVAEFSAANSELRRRLAVGNLVDAPMTEAKKRGSEDTKRPEGLRKRWCTMTWPKNILRDVAQDFGGQIAQRILEVFEPLAEQAGILVVTNNCCCREPCKWCDGIVDKAPVPIALVDPDGEFLCWQCINSNWAARMLQSLVDVWCCLNEDDSSPAGFTEPGSLKRKPR